MKKISDSKAKDMKAKKALRGISLSHTEEMSIESQVQNHAGQDMRKTLKLDFIIFKI